MTTDFDNYGISEILEWRETALRPVHGLREACTQCQGGQGPEVLRSPSLS